MKEYGIQINIEKTKIMSINGREIMKVKTIEGKLEQFNKCRKRHLLNLYSVLHRISV